MLSRFYPGSLCRGSATALYFNKVAGNDELPATCVVTAVVLRLLDFLDQVDHGGEVVTVTVQEHTA